MFDPGPGRCLPDALRVDQDQLFFINNRINKLFAKVLKTDVLIKKPFF